MKEYKVERVSERDFLMAVDFRGGGHKVRRSDLLAMLEMEDGSILKFTYSDLDEFKKAFSAIDSKLRRENRLAGFDMFEFARVQHELAIYVKKNKKQEEM